MEALLRRGFYIFPTVAGKKQFIRGLKWAKKATKDPEVIARWAKKYPGCNWGVACGPSGLFVLDIDGPEGEDSLLLLADLPKTLEVQTPHGRHLYYYGRGKSGVDIAPWESSHLDSRSVGGMVFAPGSQTEDGQYVIKHDRPIVDAPQWLIELAGCDAAIDKCERQIVAEDDPGDIELASNFLIDAEIAIEGAGGDLRTYQTACAVRDFGVSEAKCLELMAEWNTRCEPPWDIDDLAGKVANAYQYSRDSQGNRSASAEFDDDLPEVTKSVGFIEQLNQEFCAVKDGTNFLIYRESKDPSTKSHCWNAMQKQTFIDMMTRKTEVKDKIMPISKIWLESQKRRTADWVLFDPALPTGFSWSDSYSAAYGRREGVLNLWTGWAIEPKKGDWSFIREELIRKIISSGDGESYNYVMDWVARLVQFPQINGEVALVLRGKKGTGKGTLGEFLLKLCGKHSMIVHNSQGLTGDKTGHLLNKILLFADEAYWAGDKKGEGQLKSLVTGRDIPIRAMYKDAELKRNRLHILIASNLSWVVPATGDERRFAVLDVSEHQMGNFAFWDKMYKCAYENGGLAAMLYDLLERDIKGFIPAQVPMTQALADQKRETYGPAGEWWLELLSDGVLPEHCRLSGGEWADGEIVVDSGFLYDDYVAYARGSAGGRFAKSKVKLKNELLSLFGVENRQVSGGRRGWAIPPLAIARQRWDKLVGMRGKW